MKNPVIIKLLLIVLVCTAPLSAQDYDAEASQKAWEEFMTPGEMHGMLAKMAGEWNAKMKMWNNPGSEPVESEGTTVSEMIMDGRYLQSKHKSTFMGIPMHGLAIEGYDNAKKKFVNTWIDNFGTGIMISEGEYNAEKNEMEYYGKMTSPMDGSDINTRQVIKMIDDNNYIFEMYMMMGGQEVQSMEILYTRK